MVSCEQSPGWFQAPARLWRSILEHRALLWIVALVSFAVEACGNVPVITSPASASGTLNSPFSYQITANNDAESYAINGLPAGLTVDPATGLISGKPTQTGSFISTIEASNASGTGTATLTINVQTVVSWPSMGTIPSTLSGVSAVAGGAGHTLALKSDGTVVAWGSNSSGQTNVPADLNTAVAIACGSAHSMALRADGTVAVWGWLYASTTLPRDLKNVVAIAGGYLHNLALKSDGTVVAWGSDSYGETTVPPELNNVVAVAAGYNHSLALRSDGTVVGWGATFNGQATIPDGLNNVIAIASGEHHNLALKADGTVVAWGRDWNGRTAVPAGLKDVVAIACGGAHSLALKSDGTVVAWGFNSDGQATVPPNLSNVAALGDTRGYFSLALTGNDAPAEQPVIISGQRILAGASYPFHYRIVAKNSPASYAATGLPEGLTINTSTGVISGVPSASGTFNITVSATNANGTGSATLVLTVLPLQRPRIEGSLIANATAGLPFSYQIKATNLPTSYGAAGLPPGLSINTSTGLISGIPTQSSTSNVTITATNQAGSGSATLVVTPQTLVGWGSNPANETTIPPGLSGVVAIDADSYSSLALKSNGKVVAWGDNDLGKGNVPVGLNDVVAISNGGGHSLALKSDGTVVAWGSNSWGQSTVPSGLKDVVAISAGWLHSLALQANGRVVAWGHNASGEATVPPGLSNVVAIAAGKQHSVALRADGTVVSWGYLIQTGHGIVPQGLDNVVALALGENHILALKSDGTVVAWGSNWAGQCTVPSGLNNVVAVAAGDVHSMALKADGTVVAWGAVNADYLDEGQAVVPDGLKGVVAIAAGSVHSLALIGNESATATPVIISPLKVSGSLFPFRYRIVARNTPSKYDATGLPPGLSIDKTTGVISGTPTQSGTFYPEISATNANGTTYANLTILIRYPHPVKGTLRITPDSPVSPGAAVLATASGWGDPDGPLTYQFLLDNVPLGPPSSVTEMQFTAPTERGPHVLKLRVTNALGTATDSTLEFIVNHRFAPQLDLVGTNGTPVTFDPRLNDTNVGPELLVVTAVTQGETGAVTTNGATITYAPAPQFFGRDTFTYTVTDGIMSGTATVTVRNSDRFLLIGPATGEQVAGEADGSVYKSFKVPAGEVFSGKLRGPNGTARRAIFSKDGTVLLQVGGGIPGLTGPAISALGEPSGNAVLATLRGPGISAANKRALILGLNDGNPREVLREGGPLPDSLKVKRFLALDGDGTTVFLLVKLVGTDVRPTTNVALLAIAPDGAVKILARKGDMIGARQITSLTSLTSAAGTTAEDRWRAGDNAIGVRVTFSGKQQTLYTIPATAADPGDWTEWVNTGDVLPGGTHIRSFGLPGFGPDGVVFKAQLELTPDQLVNAKNDTAVFLATLSGLQQLVREGDPVVGPDGFVLPEVRYKKFGDPVAGLDGKVAFAATLAGKSVASSNNKGLWLADSEGNLRLIARTGDIAPWGGKWTAFQSLAFPNAPESGPIFTAKLRHSRQDDVKRKNGRGIWAVSSGGVLQMLLRTGDPISVTGHLRVVKSFVALTGAQGSLGSARGYNHDRHVSVIATFTNGDQAIVNIVVP